MSMDMPLFDFYLSHVMGWYGVCEIDLSQKGKNSRNSDPVCKKKQYAPSTFFLKKLWGMIEVMLYMKLDKNQLPDIKKVTRQVSLGMKSLTRDPLATNSTRASDLPAR